MIKIKKIILIIFFTIILISLAGCGKKENKEEINEKVIEEMEYLDTSIVSILNRLNNITLNNAEITYSKIQKDKDNSEKSLETDQENSQGEQKEKNNESMSEEEITVSSIEPKTVLSSNENDVNWEIIKNEINEINESWVIIILDLTYLNVNNNDILSFSSSINETILSIKDENKTETLKNAAKLYSFIPKFEEQISEKYSLKNIKQTKSYLINAYSLVEQANWTEIDANIQNAEINFKNLINDFEFIKNKEYKVNKSYVLLKELQNSLQYKDKKLFYIKYKNLLESINVL